MAVLQRVFLYIRPGTPCGKVGRKHNALESQDISHFPAGDHKAAGDRKYSINKINITINDKKYPHRKHRPGGVSIKNHSICIVFLNVLSL